MNQDQQLCQFAEFFRNRGEVLFAVFGMESVNLLNAALTATQQAAPTSSTQGQPAIETVAETQQAAPSQGAGELPWPLKEQFESLKAKYRTATIVAGKYGDYLVTIQNFKLPNGYNKEAAEQVIFRIPPGYPAASPERFFTENDLVLANNATPHMTSSGRKVPGFDSAEGLRQWFWVLQSWNPNRDSLLTYAAVIATRFRTEKRGEVSRDQWTTTSPIALLEASTQREQPAASKPEPQAQAGGYTAIERLIKWHTAMADEPNRNEAKRQKHRETAINLQAMREAIAKKDAALKACVEALIVSHEQMKLYMANYKPGWNSYDANEAAITQGQEAMK